MSKLSVALSVVLVLVSAAGAKMGDREIKLELIEKRSEQLKKGITAFTLRIDPLLTNAPANAYGLLLTCRQTGFEQRDALLVEIEIRTNTAMRIIEHLAASGFLANAGDLVGFSRAQREKLDEGCWVSVTEPYVMTEGFQVNWGWKTTALEQVRDLRPLLEKEPDTVKALDRFLKLLKDLQPSRERPKEESDKIAR